MNVKGIRVCFAFAVMGALSACASPPADEVAAARAALDAAARAEAPLYASEQYEASLAALEAAEAEIAAQEEKFTLHRDYTEAIRMIARSQTDAEAAAAEAGPNRQAVIDEVEALIDEATVSIEMTRIDLEQAPAGKDSEADLAALAADIDALAANLEQARSLAASGDYLGAREVLTATESGVTEIATQIQAARDRASGRRAS